MPRSRVPSYRRQKSTSQADRAFVEIAPGKRVYLGTYGSPESHQEYRRILGQIETGETPQLSSALTLTVLLDKYDDHARIEYRRGDGSLSPGFKHVQDAIRTMLESEFLKLPASEFGVQHLKRVRDKLLGGGLSRHTINSRVKYIRAIFRWAEEQGMVPEGKWEHLKTLKGLRFGRSGARETEPVTPVPQPIIDAVLPLVPRQVKALIQLQLLTGARPGELLRLCPADVKDTDKPVWKVLLNEHKTAHHGHARTLRFGPKAQAILREYMTPDRPLHKPLFSPIEADEEFRAKKHAASKNRRGQTTKRSRPALGDHYTVSGYRQAIQRACLKAFPFPPELRPKVERVGRRIVRDEPTKEQRAGRAKWRDEHCWHPHQLRHNFVTKNAEEHGVAVTQNIVGHREGSSVTARYIAEHSEQADKLMAQIG